MGFLDMNFDDVVEPKVVPAGEEYKLRIVDMREDTNKNGGPYIMPTFEVCDEIAAKTFTKYMGLPDENTNAKTANNMKYRLQLFVECFQLDIKEDTKDWVGEEGWAILGIEEDEEYGNKNYVKKFITPK